MEFLIYLALAVPLIGAVLSLIQKTNAGMRLVNLVGSTLLSSSLFLLVFRIVNDGGAYHSGIFYVDELSAVLLLVVALLSFTSMLFSFSYMERDIREGHLPASRLPQYYFLLNLFAFTMVLVLVLENLGLMWVAIEATTLASALLVAFQLNRSAIEAAWKYVMVCTVGICFALLGTILLYYTQVNAADSDVIAALSWLELRELKNQLDPSMLRLAFIFILIGYGTKAGLAPMHTWLPDAHSQSPSPVSGLLSGALLSCAMYVIIRNLAVVQPALDNEFCRYLLLGFGLLSVAVAVPFVLVQHDIKRLLAYSSVEHMGLIAIGLGIGTPLAVYGALLHLLNHAVVKSALFYAAGAAVQHYHTKQLLRVRGMLGSMPVMGGLFVLLLLAAVGMPPFSIFTSKMTIVWAAFQAGNSLLGFWTLLLLAGIFAGMLYYCVNIALGANPYPERKETVAISGVAAVLFSLILAAGTGLFLPGWLEGLLARAATLVAGGAL